MSDNKKKKKTGKLTDDYMSGLAGSADSFVRTPTGNLNAPKIEIKDTPPPKKEAPKVEVKKESAPPKKEPPKKEPPKVPKFIKKDSKLEKDIQKVIAEIPKEDLEKILKPTKADKERLATMDFQNRDDMSEAEKKDFIEQIAKREPEPEIAEMNGALVWKWQNQRRTGKKKSSN